MRRPRIRPPSGLLGRSSRRFPGDEAPEHLVRDRDAVYGEVVKRRLRGLGIRDRPTAPRSPWQNAPLLNVLAKPGARIDERYAKHFDAHVWTPPRDSLRRLSGIIMARTNDDCGAKPLPVPRSCPRDECEADPRPSTIHSLGTLGAPASHCASVARVRARHGVLVRVKLV